MSKLNTLTDEEIVPSIAQSTTPVINGQVHLSDLSPQLKQYLLDQCREYIGNEWKEVDLSKVTVKRLRLIPFSYSSAGTSNIIYTVTNSTCCQDDSPRTVLVRLYGKFLAASFRNQLKDAVVFTILSERSLGPKLHGIFEHGRVEEFITSRGLTTLDIRSPPIFPLVAARMAQIHNLQVPIFKSPRFLFDTMRGWLEGTDTSTFFSSNELDWLQAQLVSMNSPICFCHNDLQAGNILLRGPAQSPDDLLVIDYEYCSYNYRDYDLANFFSEWAFEYSTEHEDGFFYNPANVPSPSEKIEFMKSYIEHWNNFGHDLMRVEDIPVILANIQLFELASNMFWSLWSLRQSHSSSIGFGYQVYARVRMQLYVDLKKSILA